MISQNIKYYTNTPLKQANGYWKVNELIYDDMTEELRVYLVDSEDPSNFEFDMVSVSEVDNPTELEEEEWLEIMLENYDDMFEVA